MRSFLIAVLILGVVLLGFAVPAAAIDSFFDIFTVLPTVGFAPHPRHEGRIGQQTSGLFEWPLIQGKTVQEALPAAGGPHHSIECKSHNGLAPGQPSTSYFFDITYLQSESGGLPLPPLSFFDVFIEVEVPGAGPAHLVAINPSYPADDIHRYVDVTYYDSFFDITYRVEVGPGGGCHDIHTHGEAQQGLSFQNVDVGSPTIGYSFFDVFFELQVTGPVDTNQRILRLTDTGQFLEAPVAVQHTTWGAVKSLYR